MTTKTAILIGAALAGAWLLTRSGGATANDSGATGRAATRRPIGVAPVPQQAPPTVATSPTAPNLARVTATRAKSSASVVNDLGRVTSGVDNIGRIGTDGPFRGIY